MENTMELSNLVITPDGAILEPDTIKFYTDNGIQGGCYKKGLRVKEIAKLVRAELKKLYPSSKFSVTSEYNNLSVSLMESDIKIFNTDITYTQINHYYIKDNETLTEAGRNLLENVNQISNKYNYSDCDSMIDYFSVNYYFDLNVGKWNKPFNQL